MDNLVMRWIDHSMTKYVGVECGQSSAEMD